MVGTSIAKMPKKEVSKDGMCTHKETCVRGVVGIYEKGFSFDDDAGL
jgi:hypothetical protein